MNITEDAFERLIIGLFGEGLTKGDIEFFNENDEVLQTRDIDEALDFYPTHVSLETTLGELVGFALPINETPPHYPEPSAVGDDLNVWFYEQAIDEDLIPQQGEPIIEIPLIDYKINENNFYDEFSFDEPYEVEQKSSKSIIDQTKIVKFAMAKTAANKSGWKNLEGTVAQFIEMLTLHQEGTKDGQCFVQGESAGNDRAAKSMIKNHFIGFDLDTGETAEEIDDRLGKTGLGYVRYTTHSHMKDISEIKRDGFFRWSGMDPNKNVDISQLKRYLIDVKGFLPRVVEKLEIIEDAKVSEEGTTTIVRHSQMPKHRIIFFLSEPFIFQGKASQSEAIKAWKEHYHGLGVSLGFVYDKTCIDPARLFYLPRHAKGHPYETRFVDGNYVDIRSYDRIAMKRDTNSQSINKFQDAAKSLGATSEGLYADGYNLKRWIKTRDCEIIDLLEENYPDGIKSPRTNGPGYHIECPFEDEHSKAGGLGTYAINASDGDKGFHIFCTHDACQGRNKLDYIKKMVELEWVTVEDLQDERFCPSILRDEDEESVSDETEEDAKPSSIDVNQLISTLSEKSDKDDVIDVMRKISRKEGFDEDDFTDVIAKISKRTKMSKKNLLKHAPMKFKGDQEKMQREMDEMDKTLHQYNERYAMVDTGSKVVIMDASKEDMSFTNRDDWKALKANEKMVVYDAAGNSKMESVAQSWIEWAQRRTFYGVAFDPRPVPDDTKMNLFKGFDMKPRKGNWDNLKNHIYNIVCHGDEYQFMWLMTWMAHIFQVPWEKKGSAIVVRGTKGAGKSIVFNILKDLLGKYAMSSANSNHITGNFNWHFRDKLLLVAEEGLFAGDARDDSVLKDLITGATLTMEPKGIDPFEMKNFTRIVIISNEEWVINATPDERRYYVTEVSSDKTGDFEYFDAITDQMNAGGYEAMLYDLMNFDPKAYFAEGWNILRRPPATSALAKQVSRSIHPAERFFVSLVENMGISEAGSDIEPIELTFNEPSTVSADELRHYYYNSLNTNSGRYKKNPEAFREYVKKFFPGSKYVKPKTNAYGTGLMLRIPPLKEVIHHIEKNLNITLDLIEYEED